MSCHCPVFRSFRTTVFLAAAVLAAFCGLRTACAEDVIKDATYNLPSAVAATMGVDEAMQKMETAVAPEVLAAFKQAHPAPFWLFGEDRQLAVRNNIIPAHWFADGAKQYGHFSGVARPGEFYVFQVCMIRRANEMFAVDKKKYPKSQFDYLLVTKVDFEKKDGVTANGFSKFSGADLGDVNAFWVGIQIPENAKPGRCEGKVYIHTFFGPGCGDVMSNYPLAFSIKIEGAPLAESGVNDAWRLARLKWLESEIGEGNAPTRPFTPVKVDEKARTVDILGRRITIGKNGIPTQYTSYFSGSNTTILEKGRDAFVSAPRLEVVVAGKTINLTPKDFKMGPASRETGTSLASWSVDLVGDADGLTFRIYGTLEFDGYMKLSIRPTFPQESIKVDDIRLIIPYAKDAAKYAMGLGLQGGLAPAKLDWKWDVRKNQDAIWLGDANIGTMLRFKGFKYRRPLINAYYAFQPLNLPESWGTGGVRFENGTLTAYSGPKILEKSGVFCSCLCYFKIDWYFTPFKPLDVKQHFTDRYYHAGQGAKLENTAELRKEGATILEIHHNRLCNPYINYPFNDDSIGNLTRFVKQAHADDMRVAVYYTTRELTQNLPEFFALKSMGGEIILKRKEGVAWPVTNRNGPHPWLKEHVGLDIVPAWRENLKFPEYRNKLDLAVITTPDSRWNNFYLEGLDYLVKKAGIDGLYIDDTALDRDSMQRARRILDADGNSGRRVNMHSWNHFNGLAAWTNSSIAFMELYPYYNGLWHGEGFNANASPEYMLVEMSGIPYGLMSEMLNGPNPWHGMVFGMRTRWPWSGDPREQWKFEAAFGIADSELIGWWDPACPVRTGNDKVKATVYRKPGKTLIALGNWDKAVAVKLAVDWKALGLNPAKAKLTAVEIKKFQPAAVFAPTAEITVPANQGWLLIAE